MQKSDLTELEIELQDLKLRLARPGSEPIPTIAHARTEIPPQVISSQVQAAATPAPAEKDDSSSPIHFPNGRNFFTENPLLTTQLLSKLVILLRKGTSYALSKQ